MEFISAAITLLILMDPVGNAPVFMAVLKNLPPARRRRIIVREMLIALVTLVLFLMFGTQILASMNISPAALSISGGVILFLVAIRMVFPETRTVVDGSDAGREPLIVPLAIPLVAGPSAIAMVTLLSAREPERLELWMLALMSAWAVAAVVLIFADGLRQFLKEHGMAALERLMGIVLTAMSVQMIMQGVREFWTSF